MATIVNLTGTPESIAMQFADKKSEGMQSPPSLYDKTIKMATESGK